MNFGAKQNALQPDNMLAVITAAVTAFIGSDANIIVKSIKRIPDKSNAWSMAGRHGQRKSWQRR